MTLCTRLRKRNQFLLKDSQVFKASFKDTGEMNFVAHKEESGGPIKIDMYDRKNSIVFNYFVIPSNKEIMKMEIKPAVIRPIFEMEAI